MLRGDISHHPACHIQLDLVADKYYQLSSGLDENLHGYKELKEFIGSLKKPR